MAFFSHVYICMMLLLLLLLLLLSSLFSAIETPLVFVVPRKLNRHGATEADGDGTSGAEDVNQTLDGGPRTHPTASEAEEDVDEGDGASEPGFLVASDPALQAVVVPGGDSGGRVEALAGEFGSLVDDVADVHHPGEGVGEVHHEDGADQADDAVEVGDRAGDDEGEDPVARAQEVPEELALLLDDGGELEDGLEDLEVDRLHADVEVHDDGDPAGQEPEHVARRLEAVRVDHVDDVVGRVLAVEGVDEHAEEHVDDADEGLGHEHALPEVERVSHLGEEGHEEEGAGVGVDHGVDGVERGGEAGGLLLVRVRGDPGKDLDGLDRLDEGRLCDGRVVRCEVYTGDHTARHPVSKGSRRREGGKGRTDQMIKFTMFIHTAAFEIHPIFLKLRMKPPSIPTAMMTTIMATKQTPEWAICSMLRALLKIKMATVKNCWRDWAMLMKWRAFTPNRRKKGSPKLCIG